MFSEKNFSHFQGVQPAPMGVEACLFLWHPCFQFKCFAVFGGCNIIDFGASDVPKTHILTFRKKVLPNSGHKMAQNGPKWPKMAQNCIIIYADVLFWDILILKINVLVKSGHAILCDFSRTFTHAEIHDT